MRHMVSLRYRCPVDDHRRKPPSDLGIPVGGRVLVTHGGTVALLDRAGHETGVMTSSSPSAFAGFRFPREVISLAVRWYLRYGLSYRDVEELLAERGVTVDHVTVYRWVQRFTPEFMVAARTCRHVPGGRWFVDETYVKVNGRWTYLYRAIDQYGQVIDVWLSARRDLTAARIFFIQALATGAVQVEVTTDRAPVHPRVLDELIPGALHTTQHYANNTIEADHGRPKARLRPMRGLKTFRSARDPCYRSRVCPEPQTRPLRHRHGRTGPPPSPDGLPRAGPRHLTPRWPDLQPCHAITQRNRAVATALRQLSPAPRDQTQLLFISVDPARDKPRVLRAHLDHFTPTSLGSRAA